MREKKLTASVLSPGSFCPIKNASLPEVEIAVS